VVPPIWRHPGVPVAGGQECPPSLFSGIEWAADAEAGLVSKTEDLKTQVHQVKERSGLKDSPAEASAPSPALKRLSFALLEALLLRPSRIVFLFHFTTGRLEVQRDAAAWRAVAGDG
jgi:hypothetical protein